MLKDKNIIAFPYPVLAPWGGGISGMLYSNIKFHRSGDNVCVAVKVDLKNQYIQQLINQRVATFWLEVDCNNTKYHKEFAFDGNQANFEINVAELDERVNLFPSVVAQTLIPDFQDESFEDDYQNLSFVISKGDYIAISKPLDFSVHIDHYGKPKSIFGIHSDKDVDKANITFEVSKDKIWIKVAPEVASQLGPLLEQVPQLNTIIRTLVLVPALHKAFETISSVLNDDSQSIDEYRWVDSLDEKLTKIGEDYRDLDSDRYDEYARKILDVSFDDVISNLGKFTSIEGEDNE